MSRLGVTFSTALPTREVKPAEDALAAALRLDASVAAGIGVDDDFHRAQSGPLRDAVMRAVRADG